MRARSRSRAVRSLPRERRQPRRRAGRGDGVRGAPGTDVHARCFDVADRGDHARSRARVPGAGRSRCRAVLEGGGVGRPYELGARIGRASRELSALSDKRALQTLAGGYHLDRSPPATSSPSFATRRRPRASFRRIAPWSSSASVTRSATGGSASSRRSAAASMPRGRWRSQRGCVTRSGWKRSRSGRTTASRCIFPKRMCLLRSWT